jgi:hypothetical protein
MNLMPPEVILYLITKSNTTELQAYLRTLSNVSRSIPMDQFPIATFPPNVQYIKWGEELLTKSIEGSCGRGNEPSSSVNGGAFLETLTYYKIFKDSAPWSY